MKPGAGLALAAGGLVGWSLVEPWQLQLKQHEVAMPGLAKASDGMRVVQLSDLHAGAVTPWGQIRAAVEMCNACQPDLVVITGDFVSRRDSYLFRSQLRHLARPVTHYAEVLAQELAMLNAPLGVWGVPGNHDGADGSFSHVAGILAEAGVRSLVNQSAKLANGIVLCGIDDRRGGRPDVNAALTGVRAADPHLVLSHNPRMAWLLGHRNALVLSGHTHAGQVALPLGLGRTPIDMGQSAWTRGVYQLDEALLYVSSGVGAICLPVRLGARPEVASFVLRAAPVGGRVQVVDTSPI